MRISIFSPDHRGAAALTPTADSVIAAVQYLYNTRAGAGVEIEWLIGVNGEPDDPVEEILIPEGLLGFRFRIIQLPKSLVGSVGALKKALCSTATGDYLLELDSDDELLPAALVELCKAISGYDEEVGPELDFIFSDALRVHDDGSDYIFAANCGWTQAEYFEHKYHPTPPMSAANLYTILHAPDHFRCWRREFYNQIGGHNEELKICDDLDLMQKTYLAGANILHLDLPLYKYNVKSDGSNTWLQNVEEIGKVSANLGDRNLVALLEAESVRTGNPIIELGGCKGTPKRHTIAFTGSDQDHDLRFGIPMDDNSCTAVFAQDFLEHIPHCKSVECRHFAGQCTVGLMEEIHRVLVPGGMLIANTPSTGGYGAHCDPSHVSFWNLLSARYYTEANQHRFLGEKAGEPTCKFIMHRNYEWFPSEYHKQNNLLYLHFTLGALKPGAMGQSTLR